MASSSADGDAFPRGTYAKYKRATAFFLRWLLRARNGGAGIASEADAAAMLPLDAYDAVVAAIARQPTALAPALLLRLPRALEACKSAITLRTRVALFFGEAADDAHAHFLARLERWHVALTTACTKLDSAASAATSPPVGSLDLSNYFDVLALPDDYFPDNDEADDDDNTGAPQTATGPSRAAPALSKADRKKLQVDELADDFHTELACLFMELDELSEAVYATFLDVKREKKTLVEATVVATVAIDSAASTIASFQVRHPTLRDGNDLAEMIEERLSIEQLTRLVASVRSSWMPSEDPKEIRHQYAPGTVLVDIVGIVSGLRSLATGKGTYVPPYGARYDEATTRHFVVPEWSHMPAFFNYHLPALLNVLLRVRKDKRCLPPDAMEQWLLEPFDTFHKTGAVSTQLVFICVCWIRSIAALQGDRTLTRTISVSLMHLWKLQDRLSMSMLANTGDGLLTGQKEEQRKKIQDLDIVSALMRVNPILTGCILLDKQFAYLELGHDAQLISLFRPFCHIYSALRDRRLLDELPFVEDAIRLYEHTVFPASRAAATHGSFARSFLASQNFITAHAVRRHGRQARARPSRMKSLIEKGRFDYISHVFRLLHDNDYSMLPTLSSTSWTALLSAVADVTSGELLKTRVLSRDLNKLRDDLIYVFYSICDTFDRRGYVDRATGTPTTHLRALETGALLPLLPLLDALSDDDAVHCEDQAIKKCCQVATIIARKLGDASQLEKNYFMFPATPTWVSAEFSDPSPSEGKASAADEFTELMQMLKTSSGPLRGQKLCEFKRRVAATPDVLTLFVPKKNVELCTLLHHAAAGPAHDLYLTEWLIQMGALEKELMYYRSPAVHEELMSSTRLDCKRLPNAFAVHCAAKKGDMKMVTFMLGAGNFRDVNLLTIHTKESLARIAVQKGDEAMWAWLALQGATSFGVDANGKHIWEFASDRKRKSLIKQIVASEEKRAEESAKHDTDGLHTSFTQTRERLEQEAKEMRASLRSINLSSPTELSMHASEHGKSEEASADLSGRKGRKKKKMLKKKLKKKWPAQQASTGDQRAPQGAQLVDQMFINGNSNRRCERIQTLSAAVETLKTDSGISTQKREESVKSVLASIDYYAESVHNIVVAGLLSESTTVKREIENAARSAIMMIDFQESVAPPANLESNPESQATTLWARLTPADNDAFYEFFLFVVKAFGLTRYYGFTQLEDELESMLERCLLSISDRSNHFRQMVSAYMQTRQLDVRRNGQSAIVSTASEEWQFEWYTSRHDVEEEDDLHRLDRLFGCHHYAQLYVGGPGETSVPEACSTIIDDTIPQGRHAVYVGNRIIVGAETKPQLEDIVAVVLDAATQAKIELRYEERDLDTSSVDIWGFTFSATGIVRSSP